MSCAIQQLAFDAEKTKACDIEIEGDGTVLTHCQDEKGYGIGNVAMTAGSIYEWEVVILFEMAGNEGSCIGITTYPIADTNYKTTKDMFLYRAYSGQLYHGGPKPEPKLHRFTKDDTIRIRLDLTNSNNTNFGVLSFCKMPKDGSPMEWNLAWKNIPLDKEYFAVTLFYSNGDNERVALTNFNSFTPDGLRIRYFLI